MTRDSDREAHRDRLRCARADEVVRCTHPDLRHDEDERSCEHCYGTEELVDDGLEEAEPPLPLADEVDDCWAEERVRRLVRTAFGVGRVA